MAYAGSSHEGGAPDVAEAPTETEVRAQLNRILSSRDFGVPDRARKSPATRAKR